MKKRVRACVLPDMASSYLQNNRMDDSSEASSTPKPERASKNAKPFPTPDEIQAVRVKASSKEIQKLLTAIEQHLIQKGPGDIPMPMPPTHIAEEVVRQLTASRWKASWFTSSDSGGAAEGLHIEASK